MQARGDVAAILTNYVISERQACGLLQVAVSSFRYQERCRPREETLRVRLKELAEQYPRFGSPRLYDFVRREDRYNHKLVERVYREMGLSLRRKRRKRAPPIKTRRRRRSFTRYPTARRGCRESRSEIS